MMVTKDTKNPLIDDLRSLNNCRRLLNEIGRLVVKSSTKCSRELNDQILTSDRLLSLVLAANTLF